MGIERNRRRRWPRRVTRHGGGFVAVATLLLFVGGLAAASLAAQAREVAVTRSPPPTASAAPGGAPQPPIAVASLSASSPSPPAATPPPPSATAACVDPGSWEVARRVEQVILVSGQFGNLPASAPGSVAGVGGFVLFGQPPAGSGPSIRAGIEALEGAAAGAGQVAPWMATDEEGGPVQRLAGVIGALPSARQIAARWSPAQLQAAIAAHGAAMRELGVNVDLAPVLDVSSATNEVAEEDRRALSNDPQVVATYGTAFMRGLGAGGVEAVGKHFPGLGHATANTDLGPSTDPPLAQLEADDLIPFDRALAAGLRMVMVSHVAVPGLTGATPASLSPAAYTYLRDAVHFTGVAMTDSLDARAISAAGYSEPAAAVTALGAGADMVMIGAGSWRATVAAITAAVTSGALPTDRLDAAAGRVLTAKGLPVCGVRP